MRAPAPGAGAGAALPLLAAAEAEACCADCARRAYAAAAPGSSSGAPAAARERPGLDAVGHTGAAVASVVLWFFHWMSLWQGGWCSERVSAETGLYRVQVLGFPWGPTDCPENCSTQGARGC